MGGWGLVFGAQHSGPVLQRLLEVRIVTVEGLHRVSKQQVIDQLGLEKGIALHQIATPSITQRVEAHPWVKEVVVTRVPFHELRISVVERKPAAVIHTDSGNFLSDEEGRLLAGLGQDDDNTLPLMMGVDAKRFVQGDAFVRQAIASGIDLAKLVGHTFEGRLQINAENPSNLVASVRGVQFQFGEEAWDKQWERFQLVKPVIKTLRFDGRGRGANEVDLRYENRVIVRERG